MKPQLSVVHESEAQRQQVRLQMPAQIEIGTSTLEAVDWSHGGIAIKWTEESAHTIQQGLNIGKILKAKMMFPFAGFDLSLPVDLEVRYVNAERERIGCRFMNLNQRNISMLQYLVGAYISGEVINAGDVMDVVGRNNFTRERKIPLADDELSPYGRFKRKVGKTTASIVVLAVSVAVFSYLAMSLYERIFVVAAKSAQVTADFVTITAPSSGVVFYKMQKDQVVKKGAPLIIVNSLTGNTISVDSPCDCIVKETLLAEQERAAKGQPVMRLVDRDAVTYVNAYVPNEDVIRFGPDQEALIRLPGHHNYFRGVVDSVRTSGDSSPITIVKVMPEKKLPSTWVDDPAVVKFDTLHLFPKPEKPAE